MYPKRPGLKRCGFKKHRGEKWLPLESYHSPISSYCKICARRYSKSYKLLLKEMKNKRVEI
jgi:hypothetical protein